MKIILLGAPASGKGTMAQMICEKYNIAHISTGDIIREKIKQNTPESLELKSIIDKGNLVPDDMVLKMFEERIKNDDCKNGYLLDGFPRTLNQAERLSKMDNIDAVFDLEVTFPTLLKRIVNRRVCSKCSATLSVSKLSNGKCPFCGGEVYSRTDDNEETFDQRFKVYKENTEPLILYYNQKNLLQIIDAECNDVQENFEKIDSILQKMKAKKV
jgi:adenylate kinase